MSVFFNGNVRDAQKLLEEKARFRDLERACATSHLGRLSANTLQSQETSSLHSDLISDLKRINSHICSIALPDPGFGGRAGAQPAAACHSNWKNLKYSIFDSSQQPPILRKWPVLSKFY